MHLLFLYNGMTSLYSDFNVQWCKTVGWILAILIFHNSCKQTKDTIQYSFVWLFSKYRNDRNPLKYVIMKFLVQRESVYKWVPVTMAWRVLRSQMEEWPPIRSVAANILNKQSRTADEGWSSSLGIGRGANNASPWKNPVKKYSQGEMLPLETKQSGGKLLPHSYLRGGGMFLEEVSRSRKRDILLGTWNVRSLYRAGWLTAAARELARCKLDLVGVQEVSWDKGGTVRAGDYIFSMEKEMKIISWE